MTSDPSIPATSPERSRPARPLRTSRTSRGQALAELTLVVPILTFILLGIYDMSRVFTSQLAIEAAAREAADFGAFNSSRWLPANYDSTVQAMVERACVASSNLDDYAESGVACTNPGVTISLTEKDGSPASSCDNPSRPQGPCWVNVELRYDFDLIIPFGLDFLGTRLGLPDRLELTRSSVFAVSDFSVDQP